MGEIFGFALRLTEEKKAEVTEKEVKRKMKGAKIGTLFLIAIMSVAGVGASYAAWSQSVDIRASVTTGNFDFRISSIVVNDPGGNGATITPSWINDQTFSVTVTNTYPGWKGYITVWNQNAGTVPLKFNTFQVLALNGADAMCQAYTLKFYAPDGTVNVQGTLWDLQTLQYYSWYLPVGYDIRMAPNTYHDSLISLELDPGITDYYGSTVTFTFELTAIQTT